MLSVAKGRFLSGGGLLKFQIAWKRFTSTMSARSGTPVGRQLLEDQDELEYNITFPTPTGMEDPDVKEPVVYMLGWAGSSDKLLAKYSAIYEREGCVTLRYTLPVDKIFFYSSTSVDYLQDTSQKLVQLLDDYDLRENPVIFHIFSNAGATLYRWSAELFLKEKVNIIGTVMDSCPSKLQFYNGMKALYFAKRHLGYFNCLWSLGRLFFITVGTLVSWDPRFEAFSALRDSDRNLWPHLFLYSSNDSVMPPDQVLEVIKGRKSAGAAFVRKHDFLPSEHVQHLKYHKEKYTDECIQFLEDCLRIYDGEELDEDSQCERPQTSSVDPVRKRRYSDSAPSTSGRKPSLRARKASQSETKI